MEEELKQCLICLKRFPATADYFYKGNNGKGLHPYCKECEKEKSAKWTKDNPEKRKIIALKEDAKPRSIERRRRWGVINRLNGNVKKWQENNKDILAFYREKRKSKKHDISSGEWESCKKYFNYECAYCGFTLEEHHEVYKQDFHRDHLRESGLNDLSNCVPACKSCNSLKWKFSFSEWYGSNNAAFSEERLEKIVSWLEEDYVCFTDESK